MAPALRPAVLSLVVTLIAGAGPLSVPAAAGEDAAVRSELFASLTPVYEDTFDGALNADFWEVRQNTTWAVRDGVLAGEPSSKEFQARKAASDDPSHAGLKPVIWLKRVPEQFVCALRIRYDAPAYQRGFPLLDLGHHVHTLSFGEKATTLAVRKEVETLSIERPLFSLNQWHEVVIELKKGTLLLRIDGVPHVFTSPRIDMSGQAQIDFKGVDGGTCRIDRIRLWEGH